MIAAVSPLLAPTVVAFQLLAAAPVHASAFPRVDADIATYDAEVAARRNAFEAEPANPSDRVWVKRKLRHMVDVDQYMRLFFLNILRDHHYSPDETDYFWQVALPRWREVDRANTSDLQALLRIYRWFYISQFGAPADNDAWLIAQHADAAPTFQREVLAILESLFPSGETSRINYAYLFDRVAVSVNDETTRKPQRYATQGQCAAPGHWEPFPYEDPDHLDERRAAMGLDPLAVHKPVLDQMCP